MAIVCVFFRISYNCVAAVLVVPYETYLNGTMYEIRRFFEKILIFSDYQNLGHRHLHYFPQIIFHVFCLIMTLSI